MALIPESPSKDLSLEEQLEEWKKIKAYAGKAITNRKHRILDRRRDIRHAEKKIKELKKLLAIAEINWNGKLPVPHYNAEVRTAQLYGLYVTATKGSPGVHSPTSYHYRAPNYAVDMGHYSVQVMINAQNALLDKFGAAHFKELFGPDGWYVKNGVKYSGAFPAHGDHIHFAT